MRRILAAAAVLACATPAQAAPSASIAALQVGLRTHGTYAGDVDGLHGPATKRAVRAFQLRKGLAADGIPGPATRRALAATPGWRWRTAELQFALARHGFPSGPLDGRPGPRTEAAVRRFQQWAGLPVDGVAGPATRAALRRSPPSVPIPLRPPVDAPASDGFGPRGDRFHTGVDYPVAAGTPVTSPAAGRVTYAAWHPGGWGYLVTVAHGHGLRTLHAHLSRIDVRLGARVEAGTQLGLVGATGHATGPHLHFEARVRGAAVDPAPAF